jgi:hypothetical protein
MAENEHADATKRKRPLRRARHSSCIGREEMQFHLMSPLLVADAIELPGHTANVGWLRHGLAWKNLTEIAQGVFGQGVFGQGFFAASIRRSPAREGMAALPP